MPDALLRLRQMNELLRQHLSLANAESAAPSSGQIAELFATLLQAPAILREVSRTSADPMMQSQVAEFRCHFAQMQKLLPTLQTLLLAERARLEAERRHVRAAAEWARASRETF